MLVGTAAISIAEAPIGIAVAPIAIAGRQWRSATRKCRTARRKCVLPELRWAFPKVRNASAHGNGLCRGRKCVSGSRQSRWRSLRRTSGRANRHFRDGSSGVELHQHHLRIPGLERSEPGGERRKCVSPDLQRALPAGNGHRRSANGNRRGGNAESRASDPQSEPPIGIGGMPMGFSEAPMVFAKPPMRFGEAPMAFGEPSIRRRRAFLGPPASRRPRLEPSRSALTYRRFVLSGHQGCLGDIRKHCPHREMPDRARRPYDKRRNR